MACGERHQSRRATQYLGERSTSLQGVVSSRKVRRPLRFGTSSLADVVCGPKAPKSQWILPEELPTRVIPTDGVVLPFETRVSLVSDRMGDVKSRLAVLAGVRSGEDDRQGECTEARQHHKQVQLLQAI